MRAVHADMLTLFDSLVEVEGRHATIEELAYVHDPLYLEEVRRWVREAESAVSPIEVRPGLVVSGATWDAAAAAAGSVLRGIDAVLGGEATNGFCAVRPAARDAGVREPGRFGFFNQIAIAVRHLQLAGKVGRILVVEWGAPTMNVEAMGSLDDGGVCLARIGLPIRGDTSAGQDPTEQVAEHRLTASVDRFRPEFILLSAGFDGLAGDPLAAGDLLPGDYFAPTRALRDLAESVCDGRLVSILEGGYGADLGPAIVGHLRGLARLPDVDEG